MQHIFEPLVILYLCIWAIYKLHKKEYDDFGVTVVTIMLFSIVGFLN